MGVPISIRLDDDVRYELEAQARDRGVGLGTVLRELASQAVGHHVTASPDACAFYEGWGTPDSTGG